jgi:hypothetical protein
MRLQIAAAALAAALTAAPAFAQSGYNTPAYPPGSYAPPGADTGARPGNVVGTGMSQPYSNRASNIDRMDTRSTIAPNLPSPALGPDASPADYLRAAQSSLAAGRSGEAQQSLEMAQTRLLDRSVAYGQTNSPSDNPAVRQISEALRALAAGDRNGAMQAIQSALPAAQAQSAPAPMAPMQPSSAAPMQPPPAPPMQR